MKAWRTRDGYLAEHGGDFVLVSPDGCVVRWFGSRAYSDEDDLWHWQHVVVGNCLYERTTVERGPVVTKRQDKLLVADLVATEDRDVTALLERALATDRDARRRGCLAACFERVPDEAEREPAGPLAQEPSIGLAAELAMRASELEQQAEWQEYVDANRTAAAYSRAAVAIRAAARAARGTA